MQEVGFDKHVLVFKDTIIPSTTLFKELSCGVFGTVPAAQCLSRPGLRPSPSQGFGLTSRLWIWNEALT